MRLPPYQPLGDLWLDFGSDATASDYRRELNLAEGVVSVDYRSGGTGFRREVFSSAPDQVMAVRLACDEPGKLSFTARLSREADAQSAAAGANQILLEGKAIQHSEREKAWGTGGVHFVAVLQCVAEGGSVKNSGSELVVEGANAATLLLAAETEIRSHSPRATCEKRLEIAARKSYAELRRAHTEDHARFFNRVELHLPGASELAATPTDERLGRLKNGADDPSLAALYFHYGRYLLISERSLDRAEAFFRRHLGGGFEVRMTERPWHATELSKAAVLGGARTVVSVGGDGAPTGVHRFLARLPALLREQQSGQPLLVTTGYELALERALEEAEEPYDTVCYLAAGEMRGRWSDATVAVVLSGFVGLASLPSINARGVPTGTSVPGATRTFVTVPVAKD